MEEKENIEHVASSKSEPVKGTNGWGIAGFIASFFTTIIAIILCIIALIVGSSHDWKNNCKGFAIAGLIISGLKLLLTIIIIILISSFISKYNLIDCLDTEKCTENSDGTYTCVKDDETFTCLWDVNELDTGIEYDFDDDLDLDLDIDADYDDILDSFEDILNIVNSGYTDYDNAISYIYENYLNMTFYYTAGEVTRELTDPEVISIVTSLATQKPTGLYDGDITEELNNITTTFTMDDEIYYVSILDNDGTNIIYIKNETTNTFNKYVLESVINIFDYMNI